MIIETEEIEDDLTALSEITELLELSKEIQAQKDLNDKLIINLKNSKEVIFGTGI